MIADIQSNYEIIIQNQKSAVLNGKLRTAQQRKSTLVKIKQLLKLHEQDILDALKKDMGKPETEAYSAELLFLYNDIDHQVKNLKYWMRPESVGTSLFNTPGSSYIYPEPYGSVLVIAPWNYPVQLLIAPAVAAIAAGNAVILKPSEITSHTESLMVDIFNSNFEPEVLKVVAGDKQVTKELIDSRPDYIFFTGSTAVGSIIMQQAAKYLIPVTLELGGKSPCIVHSDADIRVAARRIAWGKCMNAGQTCIAPDYLFVHQSQIETFKQAFQTVINERYGASALQNEDFTQIVNLHHFDRLEKMIDGDILLGGKTDRSRRSIEPTLILNPDESHPAMQEEIFGPILPIMTYKNLEDVIQYINARPKPLALYLFSKSKRIQDQVLSSTSSGGVCINDTIMHIVSNDMPFGGVGASGIGSYHGKFGFDTFSHKKAVLKKSTWIDPSIRYPPYKLNWRKFEKLFLWMAK
jgi:aldehyde dehydrogenase (NAD+)